MQTFSQLLDTFIPEHYDLSLTLEREARTFTGTVTVNGASPTDTGFIQLHAKELSIASVVVDGKAATYHHEEHDVLTISHPDISAGKHVVVVAFNGTITDTMHGLYPCFYEHDGVKKELLATQFESHHAREVFPCIDEPAAKATFDLTLTTEAGVTVLGNMPIAQQEESEHSIVTRFEQSPRMSTYLLAFVVGELHKASATTKSGVEVNIWATPAQPAKSLTFALDIATRSIDFFDDYFGTPYPLPKSDHIALPDFSSGAMENWGLITYREVALLADPASASLESRQMVALVIAHELSHQWFGNLVTMQWWNDLWLNESFANMMEYVAIDALEPNWHIWLDFASHEVVQALRRDSLEGVQAIQVEVNHPDEISTLFDPSIVYAKGGRLLRMLQTFIGDDAMQAGLKDYFKHYAYQNTKADDLWECFSRASGRDISSLMNAWITQSGFPVVHVTREDGQVVLRQDQFFIGEHEPSTKLWPIPLQSSDESLPELFDTQEIRIHDDGTVPQLNMDSPSHFITHYEPSLLEEVLTTIDQQSPVDRLKLLHESTLLAQAGLISSAELIPLLDHFRTEQTEAVWGIIALAVSELKKFVEQDDTAEKKLRAFVAELARPQFDRLGWTPLMNETESDTKLRSLIIGLMLYGEDTAVLEEALRLYEANPIEQLDANLRVSIMSAAVRAHTPNTIIENLLAKHQSTTSSELREDIVAALTSTKRPEVIETLLAKITDQSVVRKQDVTRWFVWLLRNRYGRTQAWQWLRDHWSWIEDNFKSDKSYDIYPRYVASILMTAAERDEYATFFGPLAQQTALKRNIEVGQRELTHRIELIERDGPAVRDRLLKF